MTSSSHADMTTSRATDFHSRYDWKGTRQSCLNETAFRVRVPNKFRPSIVDHIKSIESSIATVLATGVVEVTCTVVHTRAAYRLLHKNTQPMRPWTYVVP